PRACGSLVSAAFNRTPDAWRAKRATGIESIALAPRLPRRARSVEVEGETDRARARFAHVEADHRAVARRQQPLGRGREVLFRAEGARSERAPVDVRQGQHDPGPGLRPDGVVAEAGSDAEDARKLRMRAHVALEQRERRRLAPRRQAAA